MSDKLENKNIETVQSSLEQITTHDELLQKLWNLKLNQIIKKERWDMYEVTTEIDDIYWKKWDTFLVKKELFDQATKEKEQQLETQATVESVNADSEKLWETVQTTIETKQQTQLLQIESQQQQRLEKAPFTAIEWYITALEELENDFKLKKKLVGRNFWEKIGDPFKKDDTKERMQKETNEKINAWIKYLWDLKKEKKDEEKATNKHNIKSLKKGLTEYTPKITQTDLDNFWDAFSQERLLEDDIKKFQAGKLEPSAGFPLTSKKYVKRAIKEDRKTYEMKKDVNKLKNDAAVLTIFGNNEAEAERYFDAVINGQMSPNMNQYNQQLANYFGQNIADYPFAANAVLQQTWTIPFPGYSTTMRGKNATMLTNQQVDYGSMNRWETLEKKGAIGAVRKLFDQLPNLTTQQKDGWTSLTVAIGLGYWIFKGVKWLFNKESGGFWKKAAILWATTLGTQALLGENPISLIAKALNGGLSRDELKHRVSNSFSFLQKNNPEEYYQLTTPAIASLTFGNLTVGDMRKQMKHWKSNPDSWKEIYEIKMKQLTQGNKQFANDFERFWPTYNDVAFKAWLTSIGMDFSKEDNKYLTTTIDQITEKTMTNTDHFYKTLEKEGLKVSSGKTKEVQEYLNSHSATNLSIYKDMENKGLIESDPSKTFTDRVEDKKNKAELTKNIREKTMDLNQQETQDLITGIELFYDEMPIDNKPIFQIEEVADWTFTMISHNGLKINFNVRKKTLDGFEQHGNSIIFSNYRSLLRSAYLTNEIMKICEKKNVKSNAPFYYPNVKGISVGKGIYINDSDILSFGKDTRIVSSGRFGASGKVAKELDSHLPEYTSYLNTIWKKNGLGGIGTDSQEVAATSFKNIVDNANTKAQVEKLSITDSEKVEIQTTLNTLRQDTTAIDQQRGALSISSTSFSSLGETTPISLEKKTIDGLNNNQIEISFKNYAELIEAAHIINRIKQETKNKIPYNKTDKWKVPFYVDGSKQIQFRQLDGSPINIFWHFASRIEDFFNKSTLNTNKEYLANYLNTWFINKTTS